LRIDLHDSTSSGILLSNLLNRQLRVNVSGGAFTVGVTVRWVIIHATPDDADPAWVRSARRSIKSVGRSAIAIISCCRATRGNATIAGSRLSGMHQTSHEGNDASFPLCNAQLPILLQHSAASAAAVPWLIACSSGSTETIERRER